ncbi:cell wall protein DAN4-like [Megalobrama amblycephala]|uniref:cell wall protein DAN4-like n=1 Tax=Megalobrama amblycephala TaxID=75352 RepID=UPI002014324F|nr:cell wall protein DAN4-like [Megalobrama amblycephala]
MSNDSKHPQYTISSTTTSTLAASFNTTTPQTILSSTALKSTAVSVTNTSTTTAGPTTEVPTVPEIVTDLEFHSSDTFTSALDNSDSQEFKNRSKLVTDQLEAVYKPKYDNFLRAIVQGFRPGSIITRTQLVFSTNTSVPSRKEISDTLLKAVETGTINTLNIISQTISVNGSTFATPAAPSTETTASRASKTELHLLQATCLIIMSKIFRLFL